MAPKTKSKQTTLRFGTQSQGGKDPTWDHCVKMDPNDPTKRNWTTCNHCGKHFSGGVNRMKHHLAKTHKDAGPCLACPKEVTQYFKTLLGLNEEKKKGVQDELARNQKLMEASLDPSLPENTLNTLLKKPTREEVCLAICEWMYVNAIAFNVVNCELFLTMMNKIGRFGRGFKPPTYHEVRVTYLKKSVERVGFTLDSYKKEWKLTGCTLMSDGWSDGRSRSIINFLVNSPKGTVFLKSIDISKPKHTGEFLFKLLDDMVEEIGEENVLQVVTDGASNYVEAGRLLMEKRKKIFWNPCAAHCIDLILNDFGNLPMHVDIVEACKRVTGFIYRHVSILNLMRRTCGRDLTRAGITRFASNYLNLRSIHESKSGLRKMFVCDEWTKHPLALEEGGEGQAIVDILFKKDNFWEGIVACLKSVTPLVKVLRLVDGDDKPAMGYVYEAMDRAKEQIASNFKNVQSRYMCYWRLIDDRWEKQLHGALHAAGYFLNPRFHYADDFHADLEIKDGLNTVIKRLCNTKEKRILVDKQLDIFSGEGGLFGDEMAKDTRETKQPALWWKRYGDSTPELQDLAVRVLSATCSSTGCERNWSTFQQVHAKRRNRLEQQRMNALVYVKYNIKLEQRKKKRDKRGDAFDPISLSDMESDDEWICEKEDPALPQDPSWMDVHEFFDEVESASSRSKKRKRKRGPRDLRDSRLCRGPTIDPKDKGKRKLVEIRDEEEEENASFGDDEEEDDDVEEEEDEVHEVEDVEEIEPPQANVGSDDENWLDDERFL